MERFKDRLTPLIPDMKIAIAGSARNLVEKSQVIITATSSNESFLPDDEQLFPEKCVIGVGSFKPDMREFSQALFKHVSQMFVDTEFALKECGDLASTTCFKSVGMALFDLFAAEYGYRQSIEK